MYRCIMFFSGGVDYTTASVELTFNAGIDRTCTNISINDDNFDEDNEMFEVALSTRDTDISIAPGRSTVTIIDNDGTYMYVCVTKAYM